MENSCGQYIFFPDVSTLNISNSRDYFVSVSGFTSVVVCSSLHSSSSWNSLHSSFDQISCVGLIWCFYFYQTLRYVSSFNSTICDVSMDNFKTNKKQHSLGCQWWTSKCEYIITNINELEIRYKFSHRVARPRTLASRIFVLYLIYVQEIYIMFRKLHIFILRNCIFYFLGLGYSSFFILDVIKLVGKLYTCRRQWYD